MEKKMTKREMFAQIKANYDLSNDEIAFIDHEIELLDRKNSKDKKPTATQKANEDIKNTILDEMECGVDYTITDMIKTLDCCADFTNQKLSALVRQLVNEKRVDRKEIKRKAYFSIA